MRLPTDHSRSSNTGFSLVEAMTAVVIVSIACTAMLLSVSQAIMSSAAAQGTSRANMLAQELMTEISACRWADLDEPSHWGPELDEWRAKAIVALEALNDDDATPLGIDPGGIGTRARFDDLDDYDGWRGPPQTRDGVDYDSLQRKIFPSVPAHEYSPYTCSVRVRYVSSSGQAVPAGTISPYRQVTIELTHPQQAPQKLSRIFYDPAPLLGRSHWFDPNAKEPAAQVTIVP